MTVDYLLVCEECWMEDGHATIVGIRHAIAATGVPLVVPSVIVAFHAREVAPGGGAFEFTVVDDAGAVVLSLEDTFEGADAADGIFSRLRVPAWDVRMPGMYRLQLRAQGQIVASAQLRVDALVPRSRVQ